jgi:hypothetical protein
VQAHRALTALYQKGMMHVITGNQEAAENEEELALRTSSQWESRNGGRDIADTRKLNLTDHRLLSTNVKEYPGPTSSKVSSHHGEPSQHTVGFDACAVL